MNEAQRFFATAPKGMESLLAEELQSLGGTSVRETVAGVHFAGSLATAYRVCLWSRLASRVLMPLAEFPAPDPETLYQGVRSVDWEEHLGPEGTLAVDANLNASAITHSRFAALKVKDAVVDQFRERRGVRPSVELERPDLRINLYISRDRAVLSLDLSGESLHRRGYRLDKGKAPLKQNLAAAILLRAEWPQISAAGGALVDPMCGSGTLPIEAAMMAGDIAPGLLRDYFGFQNWRGHRAELWEELIAEACRRRDAGLERVPAVFGFDADPKAIEIARANVSRAGLEARVQITRRSLAQLSPPGSCGQRPGLVVANPPYGERLGEEHELVPLYEELGRRLRKQFPGWHAAVFTGNPPLGKKLGLRARRMHSLYNGGLQCKLLHFTLTDEWFLNQGTDASAPERLSEGAAMFANRLRKNLKNLGRWARREKIDCYRLYDADLPEYAVAIDRYHDWVHVQEYQAPPSVDPQKAEERLREVMAVVPDVLELPQDQVFLKVRQRQKGRAQYQKLSDRAQLHEVTEHSCRFLVNFTDYLDTGLFLDHRPTRLLIRELAAGKRFLNLFAYTATASVHAAAGGAKATVSVDLSRTYIDWAKRNLALNGFTGPEHRLIQADCLEWLERCRERFDLIFLDPPTFSNSKRMQNTFDVQRDHVQLIRTAARLLAPGGVLLFSNNHRRFRMEREALPELNIEDITARTLPPDFARNPHIHNCWKILPA